MEPMRRSVGRFAIGVILTLLAGAPVGASPGKEEAKRLFQQAETSYRLGKYEDALESYDTAIRLDPSDADILFFKAETLEKMGREKDAKEIMDKAVKLDLGE